MLGGWIVSITAGLSDWVLLPIYLASYFFGGYYTLVESIQKLRIKQLEIDLLMLVAAIGAASLGNWAEGALLLFLFSISHSLEHYAMGRARRAIEALSELAPVTAVVRRNGTTQEVPVGDLIVGDIVFDKAINISESVWSPYSFPLPSSVSVWAPPSLCRKVQHWLLY